nr:uncharacterized protein LOC112036640 [Quercus suber]
MAFRGRGRGRGYGGGGGGFKYAKQEPFELFPDIELPCIGSVIKEESDKKKGETDQKGKSLTREETLVSTGMRLQIFWKSSAYFLEETVPKKSQSMDIERYSDRTKPRTKVTRDSLSQILVVKRFPQELIGGWKGQQPSRKKVRWNPESGLMRWNAFSLLICFNMFWGVFLFDLCTFCMSHLPNVGLSLMKISPLKSVLCRKREKRTRT